MSCFCEKIIVYGTIYNLIPCLMYDAELWGTVAISFQSKFYLYSYYKGLPGSLTMKNVIQKFKVPVCEYQGADTK